MIGHLLKLSAFVLIYRALVMTGIVRPFDLLFSTLKESEAGLQRENAALAAYQRDLEAKNRELTALSDRRNELLGIAAHDIRSPLTAIELYTALIEKRLGERVDPDVTRFIAVIRQTSGKILALVGDLLDFAAIEHGTLSLARTAVHLRPLVEKALEPHAALARTKGIDVRLEPGADPPPVDADPQRIEQVVANFVSNAVKFSARGTSVAVRLLSRDGEAGIAVSDEGPGIAADELPGIFAPFKRAAAEEHRRRALHRDSDWRSSRRSPTRTAGRSRSSRNLARVRHSPCGYLAPRVWKRLVGARGIEQRTHRNLPAMSAIRLKRPAAGLPPGASGPLRSESTAALRVARSRDNFPSRDRVR